MEASFPPRNVLDDQPNAFVDKKAHAVLPISLRPKG
jgi:hypothetical protein